MSKPSLTAIFILACALAAVGTSAFWAYSLKNRPQPDIGSAAAGSALILPAATDPAAAEPLVILPSATAPVPAQPVPPPPDREPVPVKPGPFVLFVGDGCPHCARVEKYLEDNGVRDRVELAVKEVYKDQANAQEMMAQAQACGIPPNKLGVPLLWTGQECLNGDAAIVGFFASLLGR